MTSLGIAEVHDRINDALRERRHSDASQWQAINANLTAAQRSWDLAWKAANKAQRHTSRDGLKSILCLDVQTGATILLTRPVA